MLCQAVRSADPATRPQVLEILDSAQQLGLTVLRTWAFSDGPAQNNALQRYPGRASAVAFQAVHLLYRSQPARARLSLLVQSLLS